MGGVCHFSKLKEKAAISRGRVCGSHLHRHSLKTSLLANSCCLTPPGLTHNDVPAPPCWSCSKGRTDWRFSQMWIYFFSTNSIFSRVERDGCTIKQAYVLFWNKCYTKYYLVLNLRQAAWNADFQNWMWITFLQKISLFIVVDNLLNWTWIYSVALLCNPNDWFLLFHL